MSDLHPDASRRFMCVLNKKIPLGKLLNALGHMTAGLVAQYPDTQPLHFLQYKDKDEGTHPCISHFPFIVLRADNSSQLRTLRNQVKELGMPFTDFTNTMTVGTSAAQLEATHATTEADLEYYGVCFFGDSERVKPLTKKFSLFT